MTWKLSSSRVEAKHPTGKCIVCLKKIPKLSFLIKTPKKEIGKVCSNDCEAIVWRIVGRLK